MTTTYYNPNIDYAVATAIGQGWTLARQDTAMGSPALDAYHYAATESGRWFPHHQRSTNAAYLRVVATCVAHSVVRLLHV
jgi:hypothetical protein